MASIYSIVYRPKNQPYTDDRKGDFIREPLQSANLITGHGIEGDEKGGHNPTRQLNVLSHEWLASLQQKGYKTEPGQFGEQIIVSGIAVESLEPGAQLQLGDSVCIEITQTRRGCERLEAAQGKTIEGVGPLGVLARVIVGGKIAVGDNVQLVEVATVATPAT